MGKKEIVSIKTKAKVDYSNTVLLYTRNGRVIAMFKKNGNFDRKLHAHNKDKFNVTITKVRK